MKSTSVPESADSRFVSPPFVPETAAEENTLTLPAGFESPSPPSSSVAGVMLDENDLTLPQGFALPAALASGGGDGCATVDFAPKAVRAGSSRESVEFTIDEVRAQWGSGDSGVDGASRDSGASLKPVDSRVKTLSGSLGTLALGVTLRRSRMASVKDLSTGEDFKLLKLLGKGGMGLVFSARQNSLNRNIALKVIRPEHANPAGREKFIAEAVVTGALDHPNIVPIHELAETPDGGVFYAMKEVQGRPWSKVLPERNEAENLDILLRVCDAIAFAHDRGIIHRDLKPDNVMLGDYGEVLVMDWGLAGSYRPDEDGHRPVLGRAGTPAYMAPEMARADEELIGPASDIYLLGAILYEIVTGLHAHTGETLYECLANAANNRLRPTDREGELVDLARKAMATCPADRFGSVQAFQAALRDYRRHQESMLLCERAAASLRLSEKTKGSGGYDGFTKAIFGYSEAAGLWPENPAAVAGERKARLALAEHALARGDCDLSLSTLSDLPRNDTEAEAVRFRARAVLAEAAARERRLRRWRGVATVLVATVLLVLGVSSGLVYRQYGIARHNAAIAELRRRDAERQAQIALNETQRARDAEIVAMEQTKRANMEKEKAEAQERLANENREKAVAQERLANAEREKAEAQERLANEQKEKALAAEKEAREQEIRANKAKDEALVAEQVAKEALAETLRAQEETRQSELARARAGWLEDSTRWAFTPEVARQRQAASAGEAGLSVTRTIPLPGGEAITLAWVPSGSFVMGSPFREAGRATEEYLHPVELTRSFYLATTELTRGQWRAAVGLEWESELGAGSAIVELVVLREASRAWEWRARPLKEGEERLPVSGVSARDIREILLPSLARYAPEGFAFRLPTEAEWEYACRAGQPTRFASGDTVADAYDMGWLSSNSEDRAHPAGEKAANAWGFQDMHGNVYELVADRHSREYYTAGPETDPRNDGDPNDPDERPLQVIRGGSYLNDSLMGRSAHRAAVHPDNRYASVGVRLALERIAGTVAE